MSRIRAARRHSLKLHQLDHQLGPPGERGFLEQRLLGPDIERRDLRDSVDQHLVIQPPHCIPIDRQPQRIAEAPRLALDVGPHHRGERIGIPVVERELDVGLAIARPDIGLGDQPEAL